MARFLIAAIDLISGYKVGEIITAQADDHVWTVNEELPLFWQVDVSQVGISIARGLVGPLMEPAMPGDPELSNDPEDRFINRGRGSVRFFAGTLPRAKERDLMSDGKVTLSLGQAKMTFRRVFWHRPSGEVRDTGVGALG